MRRLLAAVFVGAALVTLPISPAAAAAPTISDLDWSTAGHVIGTVTSNAPYVFVDLGTGDGTGADASYVGPQAFVPVDAATGTGRFDLETWGLRSSDGSAQTILAAVPCASMSFSTCSTSEMIQSPWFQPSDARPVITIADTEIGPGENLTVTSSDPSGGGELRAWLATPDGVSTPVVLDRNGPTTVPVSEGSGTLKVVRCMPGSAYYCDEFDQPVAVPVEVNQQLRAWVTGTSGSEAGHRTIDYQVTPDAEGPLSFDTVTLTDTATGIATDLHVTAPTSTTLSGFWFSFDTKGMQPGDYVVTGEVTISDARFGTVRGPLMDRHPEPGLSLRIQPDPAVVTSVSASSPFVRIGDWAGHATVTLSASGSGALGDEVFVIYDSAGSWVQTIAASLTGAGSWTARWDGQDMWGHVLPSGTYTVRLQDRWHWDSAALATVKVQHLVTRTRTRYYYPRASGRGTENGSLVGSYVGRCSRLHSPSGHEWAGSLGYDSNRRCAVGEPESIVATRHRVRLPQAARLHGPVLSVFGGASSERPRSIARVYPGVTRPLALSGYTGTRIGSRVGWRQVGPTKILRIDGVPYAVWQVGTTGHNLYDVARFRISLTYEVWA